MRMLFLVSILLILFQDISLAQHGCNVPDVYNSVTTLGGAIKAAEHLEANRNIPEELRQLLHNFVLDSKVILINHTDSEIAEALDKYETMIESVKPFLLRKK